MEQTNKAVKIIFDTALIAFVFALFLFINALVIGQNELSIMVENFYKKYQHKSR